MAINRIIILVCDGLGVGELPDASLYGDSGSNTLSHLARAVGGVKIPNLEKLGIGHLTEVQGVSDSSPCIGAYGKMQERSAAKDTTTGHWEMMGIISRQPCPTYPLGFPNEIIRPFEQAIGKKVLGNKAASGTEILKELGEEHMKSGAPIVYTSADSVFQVACHEKIVPLDELYVICQMARNMLEGEHAVGRVIARPFEGEPGNFKRTEGRKDFALLPSGKTFLELFCEAGYPVTGIGKIEDIFSNVGITESYHTGNNRTSMQKTVELAKQNKKGVIFTNLVDFDMLFGHRNDAPGYAKALEVFDKELGVLLKLLKHDDLLMITGDHGCDPTDVSTDHTREYVPMLAYSPSMKREVDLEIRDTFADLGATCAEALEIFHHLPGKSFYSDILPITH